MVIREQPFIKLFSSKEYSLFWLAALFSNIGMWALIYGRLWLMRTMTDSETLLGLVSSANLMPVLLFSIFGGVIADKYNRLKILQTTRLFFALVTLLTGLLIFSNNMNPSILIIISLITGFLLAIDIPSRASMIAKLVKKEYLAVGISMYSIVFGVSGIIGPSLFHPIVQEFGLEGLFFIIGISYVLTFFTLLKMNSSIHSVEKESINPVQKENNKESLLSDLLSGVRYLLSNKIIRNITFIGLLVGVTAGSNEVLLPALTTDLLEGDSETYGQLLLFGGISGLLSTTFLILYGQKINMYMFYFVFGTIISISLIILGTNLGINNIFIVFSIMSFAKVIFNTLSSTIIQSNVEEKFRGRVMSINQLSWGSAALGALMVGYLAEIISIKFAFQFIGLSSFFIIFFGAMLTASIILKKK